MIKRLNLLILAILLNQLACSHSPRDPSVAISEAANDSTSSSKEGEEPEASTKPEPKTGEIVIYKDRCIITTPIKVNEKGYKKIAVPGTIDPQSILFNQKPSENPQYQISKESDKATEAELILHSKNPFIGSLIYGFTGINWHMHYVLETNESLSDILNFNGFISIDNQSGADFEAVRLLLIDGQTDSLAKNQNFNEYDLNITQTLQKHKVVRIPWVNLRHQKAEQDYQFYVGGNNLYDFQGVSSSLPLQICLGFKQQDESKKDLASGRITLYVRDKTGSLRFLGDTKFNGAKAGELIQFVVPAHLLAQFKSNQDSPLSQIKGVLEQTEFKTLLTEKLEEAAYRLTIRNFGDKEATIKVALHSSEYQVTVVRESNEHKVGKDKSIYWTLKVAPKTEVLLRYRVQLKKE